jgi:hypothetical protein
LNEHLPQHPLLDLTTSFRFSQALARMNYRFLLGQAVDREIIDDIERILLSCRSIDSIRSVQSQWTGPDTFSYKAEVDFDGTYLAAKLMHIYQQEFLTIRELMDKELQVSLALFAEDVMRTVEREVSPDWVNHCPFSTCVGWPRCTHLRVTILFPAGSIH